MTVDVNEEGVITTNPEIIEENVKNKISSLLLTKEINQQIVSRLPVIDTDEVQNIVGSGKNIKQSILDICKNGKLLFMDAAVYGLYKRNTASFKDTTVILFNDEDGFSIENEKGLIIHIPEEFPIKGCVVINEKGKHICLGKTEYLYEEKTVTVPLVYENKVLSKKNKIAVEWLQDVVRKNSAENIQYIALYTLPILAGNQKNCKEALLQHWKTAELPEIIAELEKIHLGCIWMKTEMLQLDIFTEALIQKIDFEDYESALKSIKAIMDTNCIRKNSESHRKMVEILIEYVRVPTSYRDLFILLQSLGITTHEDALRFDDLISVLYTKTVMVDILTAIADGIYTKIPELFEYDVFFNEYQECISAIELHVSGLCDTNHVLSSDYSEVVVVGAGADAVDYKLISICHKGDIVVSQDYGVAAMALGKGAYAIHQSGKWYTNDNIDQMLMERHLNKKARRSSHKNHIKGPKKRTEEDDERFAKSFEKLIQKALE